MRKVVTRLLLGVSFAAYASGAVAQTAPETAAPSVEQGDTVGTQPGVDTGDTAVGEIVVTARRRSESLQNVPQTINAVSGDTVEKLNILKFEDVAAVVPGLTLSNGSTGYNSGASLRGISFTAESQASPTVALFLNDAPIGSNFLFQSLFDVGQIEVLRGPQGTLRGTTAPSGSITVTTRKPDLDAIGGYVSGTGSSIGQINAQGAISVPLVRDVLAVRVAGVIDQNEYDGVHSINNGTNPYAETGAVRASVLFKPTGNLTASVMYQHLDRKLHNFQQVEGPGATGGVIASAPRGYNGPAIAASQRLSVIDGANDVRQKFDVVTGQIDWTAFDQRLTYVGSYNTSSVRGSGPADIGNQLPGAEDYQILRTGGNTQTHELRLASDVRLLIFDYVWGAFYSRTKSRSDVGQTAAQLPGSTGSPLDVRPTIYDKRFTLPIQLRADNSSSELSFFGNVIAHLGERTELSVGGRYLTFESKANLLGTIGSGLAAAPVPVPASLCTAIGAVSNTYPGTCNFPVGPIGTAIQANNRNKDSTFIYNASLSHRLTDSILLYANTGTSWRAGPDNSLGVDNGGNDPTLASLIFLPNEKSTSYEIGAKTNFFDRRLRVNVAAFHQKFSDLIFRSVPTPYLDNNGASIIVRDVPFTVAADAVVNGFDIDTAFQLTRQFSLGFAFSYADGRVDDDEVPCRDANFDGVADTGTPTLAGFQAAGKAIALCKSNQPVSQSPMWNLTLQSEYASPLSPKADGFIRGLFTYYPENSRRSENYVVDAYGSLNVYAGIRSPDGAWEVSAFVKNAANTQKTLSRDFTAYDWSGFSSTFGSSGYFQTSVTPRREAGLNVRYAFGAR